MGTFVGHILPGLGFLLIGLWHVVNILHCVATNPRAKFESRTWYPAFSSCNSSKAGRRAGWRRITSRLRHLELYLIAMGAALSISWELFIGPARHQPLDDDWSIPPTHLNNFEHASISLFFLIYALAALVADATSDSAPDPDPASTPGGLRGGLHALAALVLAQELLLFHFHSADHMGLEGHYHWLLQLVVAAGAGALALEVKLRDMAVLSLARALSVAFQGLWFINMALVLWVPAFTPKGCAMAVHPEWGHRAPSVSCVDDGATFRAKALANLQFTWLLAAAVLFTLLLYAAMNYRLRIPGFTGQLQVGEQVQHLYRSIQHADEAALLRDAKDTDMDVDVEKAPQDLAIVSS